MDGMTTFNPLYVKYLDGDHAAALMLSQIMYWYTPGKGGKAKVTCFKDDKYWLAKSHKDWEAELGFTRRQSERCLKVLKQKGLIETQLFKFNGAPTVHIRLCHLHGNVQTIAQIRAFHCTLTCNPLHHSVESLTETTTETTAEITSSAEKHRAKKQQTPNPVEVLQGNPEGVEEKASQKDKEKAMATAAEILKKQAEKAKTVTPNTKAGLCYLWQKRIYMLNGKVSMPLTGKEAGQLAQFLKKCGDQASEALDYALNNWSKFTWEVKTTKNFSTAPTTPIPGYVLAHADILLQLIAQKPEPVEFVQPTPAPKPKAEPKPIVVEDKPTEEQILADLAFLNNMGSK